MPAHPLCPTTHVDNGLMAISVVALFTHEGLDILFSLARLPALLWSDLQGEVHPFFNVMLLFTGKSIVLMFRLSDAACGDGRDSLGAKTC